MSILKLEQMLPVAVVDFLKGCGHIASSLDNSSYLVGGMVRDLELASFELDRLPEAVVDNPRLQSRLVVPDIDIMVEARLGEFVEETTNSWSERFPELVVPAECRVFYEYLTAKLEFSEAVFPGVRRIDFSQARFEQYPEPAVKPVVRPGSISDDIMRRDFSVNALVVCLNPDVFGSIIDRVSGCDDLRHKLLRVLHKDSFRDDPARLLRAIRFGTRFGFSLETDTSKQFDKAVRHGYLRELSGYRKFSELVKLLKEERAVSMLEELTFRGLWEQCFGRDVPPFSIDDTSVEELADSFGCERWKIILVHIFGTKSGLSDWLVSLKVSRAVVSDLTGLACKIDIKTS